MKATLKVILLLLIAMMPILTFAQWGAYHVLQPLIGVNSTWHSVSLDKKIWEYAHSDGRDIRIIGVKDGDTIEVPYLWHSSDIMEPLALQVFNTTKHGDKYFYTVQVPDERWLQALNLYTEQQNFEWTVTLEGSHNQAEWYSILDNYRLIGIENEYTSYQYTLLPFPKMQYRFYRIGIRTKDNPKINKVTTNATDAAIPNLEKLPIKKLELTKATSKGMQSFMVQLQQPGRLYQLQLQLKDTLDYYRPITIAYAYDTVLSQGDTTLLFRNIANGMLSSRDTAPILLDNVKASVLKISIHNGANLPLTLADVTVFGLVSTISVRFPDLSYAYYICYGNKLAEAPSYDIVKFDNKIPSNLTILSLGDPIVNAELQAVNTPLIENSIWMWIVIAVIIVVILLFTIKMMRKIPEQG